LRLISWANRWSDGVLYNLQPLVVCKNNGFYYCYV